MAIKCRSLVKGILQLAHSTLAGHGARQLDIRFPLDLRSPFSALCSVRCAFLINRLLFLWLH